MATGPNVAAATVSFGLIGMLKQRASSSAEDVVPSKDDAFEASAALRTIVETRAESMSAIESSLRYSILCAKYSKCARLRRMKSRPMNVEHMLKNINTLSSSGLEKRRSGE